MAPLILNAGRSGIGGSFQFDQPLVQDGTDGLGIVLLEVMNAGTNVHQPAVLQSPGKTAGGPARNGHRRDALPSDFGR